MTTDQTPAQRMAKIKTAIAQHRELGEYDALWLFERCRKLERVAEAAKHYGDYFSDLSVVLREAGFGD